MSAPGPEPPRATDTGRLEDLYERARALTPEARAAFLVEACRGDARLEHELSSLLAQAEPAEAFFADLFRVTSRVVGHYRLLGPLGSGGMGTVYRAYDSRLDRQVALKFLPPHLAAQPAARERLLVEARAAAALEHPNVCSIHEIGETADGRPFIAMACYEGETLKERLRRGPLPPPEAVRIAGQIARGLGAAHNRGIVHRDIKPGNIMLAADGTVRLLDFGLAKLADVTLTGPGVTPGTIAYMSPEQAKGDPVDRRTDLWSLGVVLYEMLAGERPFRGESDRIVIQAILHDTPKPLTGRPSGMPEWLARVVERLLRKDPAARYQAVDDLLADLGWAPGTQSGRATGPLGWRLGVRGAGVTTLVAAALWLASGGDRRGSEIGSLAVLPLSNHTGDPGREYFVDGLHDVLISELSQAPGLMVVSRQSTVRYRGSAEPVPVIAGELGVDALLHGSVALARDSVRITLQLVRADPEEHLWARSFHGRLENAMALQEEVARTVARTIQARPAPLEAPSSTGAPISPEAQDAYLRGLYHHERLIQAVALGPSHLDTIRTAAEWLEKAVALAPDWAAAHAKLARAYHWVASFHAEETRAHQYYPKAKAAALRALELDPREAQAHASLGFVLFRYERDWAGAERSIRRALELDPNSHHWIYALFLLAAGRTGEAVREYRRAQERNPLSAIVSQQLAEAYACDGRPDEAVAELERLTTRLNEKTPWLRSTMAAFYLEQSMYPEAIAELDTLAMTVDSDAQSLAELAHGYARAGRRDDARRLLARVEASGDRWYAPELYLALGDTGRAIAIVEEAARANLSGFLHFRCSSIYRELRAEPRIQDIVRRLRFPD